MKIEIAGYLKIQGGGRIQIPKVTVEKYNIEKGDLIWIGKGEIIKQKGKAEGDK